MDGKPAASTKEAMAGVASGVGRSGDAATAEGSGPDSADAAEAAANGGSGKKGSAGAEDTSTPGSDAEGAAGGDASDTNERNGTDKPPPMELDADAEVDPVMLAKEFSGLLQVESGDDEVSS